MSASVTHRQVPAAGTQRRVLQTQTNDDRVSALAICPPQRTIDRDHDTLGDWRFRRAFQESGAARAQCVKIDVAKRSVRVGPWRTMASARSVVIRGWKEQGLLPADFPEPDGAGDGNAVD